ncbi:AMP-binding protein [candidate division KSB1 bacterium]|nr:AMP-binding protein [candidate division KSB1 bacterium]
MNIELGKLTIRELMEQSFRLYESLPSIAYVGESPITYGELRSTVLKIATYLLEHNISKGDRVALVGDNSPNWVIAYLATTLLGAVAVPVLPGFPDTATRHILRISESVAVFISQKYRTKIEGMETSKLQTIFSLEDFSVQTSIPEKNLKHLEKTTQLLIKRHGKHPGTDEIINEFPGPEPDDLAAIIYTSGTTGHSKGVMLTHRNITFDVVNSIKKFPINSNDRFLSILPLSHTFEATGGMLCPLAVGVNIYYMQGLPTPQRLLQSMESVKPTGVLMVPLVMDKIYRKRILPKFQSKKLLFKLYQQTFFRKKFNHLAGKKLIQSLGGQLRFFMFGGASLNEDVEVFLRDAKISYSTGYGMTETSPIMTINPFGKVRVGSCGQVIPGIELKIHQPDAVTGIGEIIVRGPIVMQGYYNNPEATNEVFLEGGWLKTGDLGYFDSDQYLFIKGRSKNVIIGSSGENIYPEIIEQQLLQSPYIQEVVVYQSEGKLIAKAYLDYDVLDQKFGRNALNETEKLKLTHDILEQVRLEINAQLPTFSAINKIVEYPEPFEKTPTNKVKRYLYIPQV